MARTGFGPASHALIHVLDCAQALPTIHKFLSPHHQVVQTRLCGGFIAHSSSLPEKWIKIYGPQPQYEGQIIIYVISPWLSVLALISLRDLLTYFLMTLALLGILSQSTHLYFIWHETIGLRECSLYRGSICICFSLIIAETVRAGLLSSLQENMYISGCV